MQNALRKIVFTGLFLIPFVPFPVSSSFFFPFITTKAFVWRIIVEIIFAAWVSLDLINVNYRPRKSVIFYSIFGFLVIIGLADLLGVAPIKSFWSNFERMEGFITLLHLGMFFIVISSVFREIDWKRWWNTSLVASFLMVVYCVLQIIGLKTINQGGVRVDGTFGNAIYLAVYMLFHIFVAMLFLWREWKNVALRWVYGLLILTQVFILYYTATRGAMLGLLGGLFVMAVLNIWNREDRLARKMGVANLVGLLVLVGGFFLIRNTDFVLNDPVLSRFSSLNAEELKTQGRYFVWPMALEGVKERPLLGWGQENFSYVFQKNYSPEMYRLEPWFDRAHNIFLDWAVAGGILGLLSYLSLYVALLFSIWRKNTNLFHTEKSILTGLVAAYFFHNFFVFDHLISYIFFFSLLAYLHQQTSGEILWTKPITTIQVRSFILLVVLILFIPILYFVNIRPIRTNVFLIEALKFIQTPGETAIAAKYFEKAYSDSYLGRTETVEHLTARAATILSSDMSMEEKNAFFNFTKNAVLKESENLEKDARFQLVVGSFLSTVGLLDDSLVRLARAKELVPGKQQVYFEIGAVYLNRSEPLKALMIFKEAHELAPEYLEARLVYLIGAIYAGDRVVENEIMNKLAEEEVVFDDRIINAYYTNGRIDEVVSLLETRIRLDPANTDTYRQYLETVLK